MGSYKELYITIVLRILLGQSLKISVIVIPIRYDKNQATNTEQVMKYRDETCLIDLQRNLVNFNICLKIVALKAKGKIFDGFTEAIPMSYTVIFVRLGTICVSVKERIKQSFGCRSCLVVMFINTVF